MVISLITLAKPASAQQSNVSFQVFYDQLSPYGQWVNYPNYGYVWIPDMGPDFVPYSTGGHWIMTDYGWTWVSDYDWGWAPFHYGRGDYDNYYGWLWVPDNEWGPSWVTWRRADGYYGWEPMAPGISISMSFGGAYNSHGDHWMFVRDRDIERPDIRRYYVNRTDHDRIVRNSSVINKTYFDNRRHTTYVSGPPREDVQRATGRKINPVTIQENNKPGQNLGNGQLRIYRPQVVKNNNNGQKPTPTRVSNLKDVRRTSERTTTTQLRNVNPQDNRDQQQRNSTPTVRNNNNEPVQQQKSNPANTNGRERQNNTVKPPQNSNNNSVQPTQPQQTKPAENNRREQRRENVKPQENNNQPPQHQQTTPSNNNGREQQQQQQQQQPNTVKPQRESSNHNVQPTQPTQTQPQQTKPAENNRREQPQQNVKPKENNNAQPQRSEPSNDNGRERRDR